MYQFFCQGFAKDLPYQLACILVQQSIVHVESTVLINQKVPNVSKVYGYWLINNYGSMGKPTFPGASIHIQHPCDNKCFHLYDQICAHPRLNHGLWGDV